HSDGTVVGSVLPRARDLRHAGRRLRRPPRPAQDPHARRPRRPSASQGLPAGRDADPVQRRTLPRPRLLQGGPERARRRLDRLEGWRPRRRGRDTESVQRRGRERRTRAERLMSPRTTVEGPVTERPVNEQLGDFETKHMRINVGPQHPSTHGVLRLVVDLDGERIVSLRPHVGYLHTGFEKTMENRTYQQGVTYSNRMDYVNGFAHDL